VVWFIGNSTPNHGGGIYNSYTHATLTDITFEGNSAKNGGGMNNNNSDPKMTNITFMGNTASERGGGLYNYSSDPVIKNATFYNNSALTYGGGIFNSAGSLLLDGATLTANTAGIYGGGMATDATNNRVNNSIFWRNTAVTSGSQIYSFHSGMPIINDSVIEGGCPARGVCTNIISSNPLLGPPDNYGGPTWTIPLLVGSSAIDAGNDATCSPFDQRGVPRPQGPHCDIGAYEATGDPTSADLLSFSAIGEEKAVKLVWETTNEVNNLGFNMLRATSIEGARTRINERMIPSSLPGSLVGSVYEFLDESARLLPVELGANKTFYYWLETVDIYGRSELQGPIIYKMGLQQKITKGK
jgi:hypothetical protein